MSLPFMMPAIFAVRGDGPFCCTLGSSTSTNSGSLSADGFIRSVFGAGGIGVLPAPEPEPDALPALDPALPLLDPALPLAGAPLPVLEPPLSANHPAGWSLLSTS